MTNAMPANRQSPKKSKRDKRGPLHWLTVNIRRKTRYGNKTRAFYDELRQLGAEIAVN